MGRPWKQFQDELDHRGKGLQWLADQMGCSIQRVQNWTSRGVPRGALPDIAQAFGESVDWAAGLAPPKREAAAGAPPISNSALLLAYAYDRMTLAERMRLDRLMTAAMDIHLPAEDMPTDEGGLSGLGPLEEDERKAG